MNYRDVHASYGGDCTRIFLDEDDVVQHDKPEYFQGTHEEADTLIPFHVSQISGNVLVRATDTDILVLLVGMLGKQKRRVDEKPYNQVILDCGRGNERRLAEVTALSAK